MRINPMVKKDIKVQARSMRICWEIFVYEAIMDEPLQGLDAETKEKVATVIKTQTAGKTVLFVTHDEKEAEFFEAECMELV